MLVARGTALGNRVTCNDLFCPAGVRSGSRKGRSRPGEVTAMLVTQRVSVLKYVRRGAAPYTRWQHR